MKKYPIIKRAKAKYYASLIFCAAVALAVAVANVVVGLRNFGEYPVGTIIGVEIFFTIFIIIPIVIMIVIMCQKSSTFCSVGYDEEGIHLFDSSEKEKRL